MSEFDRTPPTTPTRKRPVIEITLWSARQKRKYTSSETGENYRERPRYFASSSASDFSDEGCRERASPTPRRKRVKSEDDSDYEVNATQKPKKRLKRSIKLEEEDYKPVIKQEKNYDFPVKKEEEKDVKLNIKDEKNGLTPDTKKAILANIPPYQMPEHLTRQFLDETIPRVMLTWAFGAHPQFMFIDLTFLDRSIVRGAMAATYAFNPDAPRAPGQHGIHLRPHETGARLNPFPVFICNEKARWNYRGHYIGDRSAPMPAAIYNQQSELFKKTWMDAIYGGYSEFRAEAFLKLNDLKLDQETLSARFAFEESVGAELNRRLKNREISKEQADELRDEKTGLTRENLEFALSSGLMVRYLLSPGTLVPLLTHRPYSLHSTVNTCVHYDEGFQRLMIRNREDWRRRGEPKSTRPEIKAIKKAHRAREEANRRRRLRDVKPAVKKEESPPVKMETGSDEDAEGESYDEEDYPSIKVEGA